MRQGICVLVATGRKCLVVSLAHDINIYTSVTIWGNGFLRDRPTLFPSRVQNRQR
jgi:hypothetical protein